MVAFAQSLGLGGEQVRFLASDGPHEAWQHPEGIALAMGAPSELMHLSADHFEVNTGSPHYIVATEAPLETLAVEERGAALRYAAAYQPDGINVNFAQFDAEGAAVRTYERGVEAETWSCGTGAVAVALVWAARFQAAPGQQVPVRTRGGLLHVQLPTASQPPVLIGPAQFVFQGALEQDERHRPEQPATEATRPA
jgi:diaminopimelate epimerase